MIKVVAWTVSLLLVGACGTDPGEDLNGNDGDASATLSDAKAGVDQANRTSAVLPAECAGAGTPPTSLACTGLYADLATKAIAGDVRSYAPAVPLWSDGAEKKRWVWLPPGTTIDASDPNEWLFPVGTKFWKEFQREGRRIETRLWQKVRDKFWVSATYAWNADETRATSSSGGDIQLPSGAGYHIPTGAECDKCHRGRTDNILGFEQVGLGLQGAEGITLAQLAAEGLLVPAPAATTLTIGDDGSGKAAPALAWLHVNCGVTCHNRNSNATAYGAGMRLRLDPTLLDGRAVNDFDPLRSTQGITVNAPSWNGQVRIVPGDPSHSLLYSLISHRGPNVQMPPIASDLIDQTNVTVVEAWIRGMRPLSPPDAGLDAAPDSPVDASLDAPALDDAAGPDGGAAPDAAGLDDAAPDAGVLDDAAPDGGVPDDAAPDGGVPDDAALDGAVPNDAALDGGVPNDATPDSPGVDDGAPDGGDGDRGDASSPDDGDPDASSSSPSDAGEESPDDDASPPDDPADGGAAADDGGGEGGTDSGDSGTNEESPEPPPP